MKSDREKALNVATSQRSVALILLALIGITTSRAYAVQKGGGGQERAPRTLERLDVGHELPIEIVAVRNLQQAKHWIRDLELDIKNVSTKPICEVFLLLSLPDDKYAGGAPFAVSLQYGRFELIHPTKRASADDRPIGPGGTAILRVHERLSRGYERHLAIDNVPESASYKLRLMVVAINFGDGTGFVNGGVPYPAAPGTELRPHRYVSIPIASQ